jgi:general secretion pathway protein K
MKPAARRGVALVLVLWIVVILGAVAAGVAAETQSTTSIARNARARLVSRYAAESGIEATVAMIEDSLALAADNAGRRAFLNSLEQNTLGDTVVLDDARFSVAVVDASARLDLNAATEESLARFFSRFTDLGSASMAARGIRSWIERDGGPQTDKRITLDSSGRYRAVRPLTSIEELRTLGLVSEQVLQQAAPYLTVDGDGTINQVSASPLVRSAAGGELRDEPARLVLIARGWEAGHPLTHEIQAVFSITGARLVLAHWRERPL